MNNAIYVALSQQTNLFRNMDVVANNVANVSTPGFKGETMVFEKFLFNDKDNFSRKVAFSQDIATFSDFKDGAASPTGRDLDLALEGSGFFKVQTPQGVRYTRRGSFHIDTNNQIVTAEGFPLLNAGNKPIEILNRDERLTISSDGTIRGGDDGQIRGEVGIAAFENSQKLIHTDNGLYSSDLPPLRTKAPAKVLQGALEQSNVNSVTELTNLININRSVGSVSGLMADMHDMMRKAITSYTRSV
jgi:flagellar basal-body rod protein FlgF